MNRREALDYLVAERRRLTARGVELQREFAALRNAGYSSERWADYRRQLLDYHGLLQNHLIALDWTLHPPRERLRPEPAASLRAAS